MPTRTMQRQHSDGVLRDLDDETDPLDYLVDPEQVDHLSNEELNELGPLISPPKQQAPKPPMRAPKQQAPKPPVVQKLKGMTSRNDQDTNWEAGGKQGIVGTLGLGTTVTGKVTAPNGSDSTGFGTGLGTGVVGLAQLYQGVTTVTGGKDKIKESKVFNDKGLETLGKEDVKDGLLSVGQTGLGLAKTGAKIGDSMGLVGSGLTMSGLGILTNTITLGVSSYDLYKTIGSLWPDTKSKILSGKGSGWNNRIMNQKKVSAGISTLKILAASAGIVGGALLLASNPVGWAIALGGTIVSAGIAGAKLYKSIKSKREISNRLKVNKEIDNYLGNEKPGLSSLSRMMVDENDPQNSYDTFDPKEFMKPLGQNTPETKQIQQSQPQVQEDPNEEVQENQLDELVVMGEFKYPKKGIGPNERDELKQKCDEAKAQLDENARVAADMRTALMKGGASYTKDGKKLEQELKNNSEATPKSVFGEDSKQYSDAILLTERIGVSVEEAVSSSGQQLMEKKISAFGG